MGLHDGVEMDPNQSREVDISELRQKSLSYFKNYFPDLAEQYAFEQLCYYTVIQGERGKRGGRGEDKGVESYGKRERERE